MTTNQLRKAQTLRKFRIKHKCYVNYRVALVGEITTRFLSNLAQKSIVPYPELTLRLILVWHHLGGSFHSLSPLPTHPPRLETPSFILHLISLCSKLFQLPPCYS